MFPENAQYCSVDQQKCIRYTIRADESGIRLDLAITRIVPGLTRSRVKRLVDEGRILIDGKHAKPAARPRAGQQLDIYLPTPREARATPEPIPLTIVYEDSNLLVVDKPAGMVVHPGAGVSSGTLVNALLYHCKDLSGIGGVLRPGIVHRLDKNTSGLLVVAKTEASYRGLQAQFKERKVSKTYIAVVYGNPQLNTGTISLAIGRHPVDRTRMSTHSRTGRMAVTRWRVMCRFAHFALLEVELVTGRTHQVRVHLHSIGHPVVGDPQYGGKRRHRMLANPPLSGYMAKFGRQALHAHRLGFLHPVTGEHIHFTSPLPGDIQELISMLEHYDAS